MGRETGSKSSSSSKSSDSLWAGILVGMVIGVAMAAVVAWFLTKSPQPFRNREQPEMAKPDLLKGPVGAAEKPPAAGDGKQRFEFYKMLTDKQAAPAVAPARPQSAKPAAAQNKSAAAYEPQILQAGSFSNVNDAENLRAKLALLGIEANIQSAAIPDKGVWYRVRLGPYKNADDMNQARGYLKQNGVDSTPMRAQ